MTFKEYRRVDLLLLAVITFVFELIATMASVKWFWFQAIAISITLTMVCITMMRWSGYAGLHCFLGGLAYCIASGATPQQYVIYALGNMGLLLGLLLIKLCGKERIRESRIVLTVYVVLSFVGMIAGRWLVGLLFGGTLQDIIAYFMAEMISLLFAIVVLNLMKKTDGMIEDQKAYLLRLEREKQEENHTNDDQGIIL